VRRTILVGGALFLGASSAGPAQVTEEKKETSSLPPEQLIDEALRRYEVGDFNDAAIALSRVRAQKPDLDKIKLLEGLLQLERRPRQVGDAINALGLYNESAEGKNDHRGHAALGKIYKESRMYQAALRPLEKAKALAPATGSDGKPLRAMITMDLAECFLGQKKQKLAMTTAKEAESMAPNDAGIQTELARIAMETKDHDAAVKATDRAIALLTTKVRNNPFKILDSKELLDCTDVKIKALATKLEENIKDAQTYLDLAAALREKSDVEKRMEMQRAREYGLKGIAKDPKFFKLQVFVAEIEAELGGLQDAIDRLNETINNDPNNQEAIRLRSAIQQRFSTAQP
jgi:tetratricopeptide (TPR) repeat protein